MTPFHTFPSPNISSSPSLHHACSPEAALPTTSRLGHQRSLVDNGTARIQLKPWVISSSSKCDLNFCYSGLLPLCLLGFPFDPEVFLSSRELDREASEYMSYEIAQRVQWNVKVLVSQKAVSLVSYYCLYDLRQMHPLPWVSLHSL